jgi:hypothetical protein
MIAVAVVSDRHQKNAAQSRLRRSLLAPPFPFHRMSLLVMQPKPMIRLCKVTREAQVPSGRQVQELLLVPYRCSRAWKTKLRLQVLMRGPGLAVVLSIELLLARR